MLSLLDLFMNSHQGPQKQKFSSEVLSASFLRVFGFIYLPYGKLLHHTNF